MAEQAYAYVTLIPVAKGFERAIAKEMGHVSDATAEAGERSGSRFVQGFGSVMRGLAVAGAAAVGVAAAGIGVAMNKGFSRLQNIENARNLLQGIGHDAESVETIMDNALESVLGTAFGLDEAAKVAASAVAAGIEPGEALERQLKIIGDTAVVAGSSMEDIGAIMGKVTTSNRATNRELQQLAERGIPVYQMLADEAGVAADEVFDMASRGEISAEMLANALETNLGGAALKAGETTEGAFANMNASIARVGANLIGPVFDQLAGFFGGLTDALKPVEEIATELGVTLGEALEPVFASIIDLVPKLVDSIVPLLPVLIDLGVAILDMVIGLLPLLIDFVAALVPIFEALVPVITNLVPVILELAQSLLPIFVSLIAALVPVIQALAPVLVELVSIFAELIASGLDILLPLFEQLAPIILYVVEAFTPLITTLLPLLVGLIESMLPTLILVAELMALLAPVVVDLVTAFNPLIDLILPILVSLLEMLVPAFVLVAKVMAGVVQVALNLVIAIVEKVIGVFQVFITAGNNLRSSLQTAFQSIGRFFGEFWDNTHRAFAEGVEMIVQFFRDLPDNVLNVLVGAGMWLVNVGRDIMQGLWNGLRAVGDRILGWIRNFARNITDTFGRLLRIKSPSLVFMEFGENIGEGLLLGMQKMEPQIESQVGMLIAVPDVDRSLGQGSNRTVVYNAAPNQSLSAEQELMKAMRRARLVAQW